MINKLVSVSRHRLQIWCANTIGRSQHPAVKRIPFQLCTRWIPVHHVTTSWHANCDRVRAYKKCCYFSNNSSSALLGHSALCDRVAVFVSVLPKRHLTNFDVDEKAVQICTCGNLYRQWKHTKPGYQNAPSEGLILNLSYVCSLPATDIGNERCPVVLCLHGSPGHGTDFVKLISGLGQNGCAAIALTLPDAKTSVETGCYWHTAEEKAQVVIDFLKAINISEVDMIVSHSVSVFPSLMLVTGKNSPRVKSLTLLNPLSYYPVRAVKPFWLAKSISYAFKKPLLRPLARLTFDMAILLSGRKVAYENPDNPLVGAMSVACIDFAQMRQNMLNIAAQKLPTLMIYSENDTFIETKASTDFFKLMGYTEDKVWHYDAAGQLSSKGSEGWLKVIAFAKGSHYVFGKYHNAVQKEILQFLKKVL